MPKIDRHVEQDVTQLYSLYKQEELSNSEAVMLSVWNQARAIFENEKRDSPYYLIFMMKTVSPRMQSVCCGFAIATKTKFQKGVVKDSLVWYCDKKKGIFKLVKSLCDLRRKTAFSEAGWTSDK